ncbi:MAG: hypothetical protein WAN93_11700 [Solirubrobacteraceae bacterium]
MSGDRLPEPRLARVYRLEATLGQPLDLGERPQGHRRIAAPQLDWLNKGVFISVGGRQATGVTYETYLVG